MDEPPTSSSRRNEEQPLLSSGSNTTNRFDSLGLRCLLIQHLSNAWGDRTAEFALYLYLIVYFKTTLLPSSILGFSMTFSGIALSRWMGSLVDRYEKLSLVRACIVVQKLSTIVAYASFAFMLSPNSFFMGSIWPMTLDSNPVFSPLFILLVFSGCVIHLSNICISIAVERDWATCISQGPHSSRKLARLNTYLRQINLLCKLCAPLFVSFLTVKLDNSDKGVRSIGVLGLVAIITMVFELFWIGVVYKRFPQLAEEQERKNAERRAGLPRTEQQVDTPPPRVPVIARIRRDIGDLLSLRDWRELVHIPVFLSSLSISLLYLTVLSFDGIMVGYLKMLSFSDDFIAEMRGLCVITGLLGTAIASPLERKIGSVRAGNWSIWSMVLTLVPVMVSFYAFSPSNSSSPSTGIHESEYVGMALSRIGLWAFDLIQTKQLQTALTAHPRRNTLTGLQFTMQNIADLCKYLLIMILYQPSQFRWAATVSFASVSTGAVVYTVYVKKERGHITHIPPIKMDWIRKVL
ncbi:hypothetical protein Moror_14179 [Moniliophthora roreri MCA 2997]|uniref:Solute carrier family 40 member n=1 Tax=Moniliophthora roreri (strain MCA 2997) TaxID=1381753 RepID=V2XPK1_MONRO|nr:hypothetical protein Moror_14179 [Moniliophthora roreri MCA 2997]